MKIPPASLTVTFGVALVILNVSGVLEAAEKSVLPAKFATTVCPRHGCRAAQIGARGAGTDEVRQRRSDGLAGLPLPPTSAVPGNGLPVKIPPASLTVTFGVALLIVNVTGLLEAAE